MNCPYLNYRQDTRSIPQSGGYANEPTPDRIKTDRSRKTEATPTHQHPSLNILKA